MRLYVEIAETLPLTLVGDTLTPDQLQPSETRWRGRISPPAHALQATPRNSACPVNKNSASAHLRVGLTYEPHGRPRLALRGILHPEGRVRPICLGVILHTQPQLSTRLAGPLAGRWSLVGRGRCLAPRAKAQRSSWWWRGHWPLRCRGWIGRWLFAPHAKAQRSSCRRGGRERLGGCRRLSLGSAAPAKAQLAKYRRGPRWLRCRRLGGRWCSPRAPPAKAQLAKYRMDWLRLVGGRRECRVARRWFSSRRRRRRGRCGRCRRRHAPGECHRLSSTRLCQHLAEGRISRFFVPRLSLSAAIVHHGFHHMDRRRRLLRRLHVWLAGRRFWLHRLVKMEWTRLG